MPKYVMIAQSTAKPDCDAEFNEWYDNTHLAEILSIPGVVSARRFAASPVNVGEPGQPYMTMYEVEADTPMSILAEIGKRSATGEMKTSDSHYSEQATLWFYEEIGS